MRALLRRTSRVCMFAPAQAPARGLHRAGQRALRDSRHLPQVRLCTGIASRTRPSFARSAWLPLRLPRPMPTPAAGRPRRIGTGAPRIRPQHVPWRGCQGEHVRDAGLPLGPAAEDELQLRRHARLEEQRCRCSDAVRLARAHPPHLVVLQERLGRLQAPHAQEQGDPLGRACS